MATITVKNIPDSVYNTLKELASAHHRSVNGEIVHLIEKATRSERVDPDALLVRAHALRKKTQKYQSSDAELSSAKNEGRP
jgi:plasmid stability protein